MDAPETAKQVFEFINDFSGRRILTASSVAERIRTMGIDVKDEFDQDEGRMHMVIGGQVSVPRFTSQEEQTMLNAECRGGYAEETDEMLVEELDVAFALFRFCFPSAQEPERYHGRGRTMDSVKQAFQCALDQV